MRSDQAQDLIEYALLLAVIVLVVAGLVTATGGSVRSLFSIMNNRYSAAGN